MNLLTTKIVTMSILGLVSLLVGFIPMIVAKKVNLAKGSRGGTVVSCLSCFGGGVILTTALTHMLPEVNLFLQYNIDHGQLPNTGLPLAEIWVLCGFFMIYFIEELTHLFMSRFNPEKDSASTKDEKSMMLNGNGHGHSHDIPHGIVEEGGFEAALRGFLVVLAISLHAVFEGIAMGLTNNTRSVWLLFIAISAHKYVISFCISMQFVTSGLKPLLSIIYFSTFALISPVGAGIGILLSETVKSEAETQTVVVTVLQGLATGTLLYVVFFEVIEKERQKGTSGMIQIQRLQVSMKLSRESKILHSRHFGEAIRGLRMAGVRFVAPYTIEGYYYFVPDTKVLHLKVYDRRIALVLQNKLAQYGFVLRCELESTNAVGHVSLIAKQEFEAEGWEWQEVARECQGFEGAAARIVLKNLVMMTTKGGNYCAGWEVEVIGGDLLREDFGFLPLSMPHYTTSFMYKSVFMSKCRHRV